MAPENEHTTFFHISGQTPPPVPLPVSKPMKSWLTLSTVAAWTPVIGPERSHHGPSLHKAGPGTVQQGRILK